MLNDAGLCAGSQEVWEARRKLKSKAAALRNGSRDVAYPCFDEFSSVDIFAAGKVMH